MLPKVRYVEAFACSGKTSVQGESTYASSRKRDADGENSIR